MRRKRVNLALVGAVFFAVWLLMVVAVFHFSGASITIDPPRQVLDLAKNHPWLLWLCYLVGGWTIGNWIGSMISKGYKYLRNRV